MLTTKRMLTCIRPQDWFAAIDLKDAYFHVSILPRHRPFLRFAFEGRAYRYKVLPFGLSLSPRVFTKVAEAALSPLWQTGIHILNYLDDWLLIAHPRDLLCKQRDLVLRHLSHLGLQVNREKSKLSPVQRISFLGVELDSGVPLGQVSRHLVVYTDASSTGWGAVCNGQAASGSWTGPRLQWHINCLELLAVLLALRRFRPTLHHKHMLVRTDSTATVAYINHQGGELNHAADQLSRQSTHPGEWRLHPETVQLIWSHFGGGPDRSVCFPRILPLPAVLLPQRGSQQPRQGRTGTQLASGAQVRLSPSEPPCTDTVQDQGGRGAGSAGCAILAHPDLVSRTHFPHGSPSLENPLEERPSFSGDGHNLAPAPPTCGTCMSGSWTGRVRPLRPSTGRDRNYHSVQSPLYKAGLCAEMGSVRRLVFLSRGGPTEMYDCSSAFLPARKVGAQAVPFNSQSVRCCHCSVPRCSGWNIPRPHPIPSWDLSVALQGLREAPFEPLASVELKYLSFKTALLTALASIKRVGDLQAFSVDEACLEFGPGDSHVILRPRPGYVPKVPTTPFRDQVVNLQALPLEEADPASARLCPVRALRIYVDRTRHFRHTEQLFVCFGGRAMPLRCSCPLHTECYLILCVGSWRLTSRYL
ncbi:Gag-Pol polyprotein [Labeo rohita]|uniref:ribonuclease H n=1 Tax=Labeo rohita TaxID=84645 RepID=A0ABQ8LEV7_LABRO|nr:Gag-Pol polyprotein [Labeo rohita]